MVFHSCWRLYFTTVVFPALNLGLAIDHFLNGWYGIAGFCLFGFAVTFYFGFKIIRQGFVLSDRMRRLRDEFWDEEIVGENSNAFQTFSMFRHLVFLSRQPYM